MNQLLEMPGLHSLKSKRKINARELETFR